MRELRILIGREFSVRVVKRGFLISTLLGLIAMVGISFLPSLISWVNRASVTNIVLNDPSRLIPSAAVAQVNRHSSSYSFRIEPTSDRGVPGFSKSEMLDYMRAHHTKLVVVVNGSSLGLASFVIEQQGTTSVDSQSAIENWIRQQVVAARTSAMPPAVVAKLAVPVSFTTKQWVSGSKTFAQLAESETLVYVLLFLLFFTSFMYGVFVAQGLVEEKSNRVVEMMLIAARPWQILFGKIIGLGLVALVQYGTWLAGAGIAFAFRRSVGGLPVHGVPALTLSLFPVFFILGYLLYASLFAIAGSLVHRTEELQMAIAPITMPIVVVFYVSLYCLYNPGGLLATIVSFIPLFTPLTMFVRVALTSVPAWQVVCGILLNIAAIWATIVFGAKVYRRFALRTTGKVGWKILFRRAGEV